jgi:hypothetical protein
MFIFYKMQNFLRKKNFFLILMCLYFYSNQKPFKFTLYSNITDDSELNPLHFDFDYICNGWIPSLINPILIIPESKTIDNDYLHKEKGKIHLADILFKPLSFDCDLYELFFNNTYNTFIGQCPLEEYQENMHYRDCYFGLSPSVPKETESSEKIGHNLALLTNNHTIDNKIFSFEKWEIKDNLISSKFLIGDSHDHFKVEDGYIGQCKMTDNEYNNQQKVKKKHSKKNYAMYVPAYPQAVPSPNLMVAQPQPLMPLTPQPIGMMQPIAQGARGPIVAVPIGPPVTVAQPIGTPVMMAQPVPVAQPVRTPVMMAQPVPVPQPVGTPVMMAQPVPVPQPMPQPPPQPIIQKPKPKKPQTIIIKRYYKNDDCCNVF